MTYRASAADADLASRANQAGTRARVTPRQIWRWRRYGLIPQPSRTYLGKARGSRSDYPEETTNLVVAIANAMHQLRRLDDVVLALFGGGFPVDFELVRTTLVRRLSSVATYVESLGGESADPLDRVERAGLRIRHDPRLASLTSMMRTNLASRGTAERLALLSAINDWILIFVRGDAGAIRDPGGEFLSATGWHSLGPLPVSREQVLARSTARELVRLVEGASDDELVIARKGASLFFNGLREINDALVTSGELRRAYGRHGETHAIQDAQNLSNSPRGWMRQATFILSMLFVLSFAGEREFRDEVVRWVLQLRLFAAWYRGGATEVVRLAQDYDHMEASIRQQIP